MAIHAHIWLPPSSDPLAGNFATRQLYVIITLIKTLGSSGQHLWGFESPLSHSILLRFSDRGVL